jgi:hypothetical protein
MNPRIFGALVALLTIVGCGSSGSSPLSPGATAASIAVQTSDLPKGMVRCDLSGDIQSFITKEATPDPTSSKTMSNDWADARKKGATQAYTAFYSDTASHCAAIKATGSDPSTASYPLVINFVIQFKDEASAAKGYTNEKIFNFSAAELKTGGQPVVEGTKTGLTPNSIVLDTSVSNQTFFIAVWQNKAFMVILAILNLDSAASKKVATSENSRIR